MPRYWPEIKKLLDGLEQDGYVIAGTSSQTSPVIVPFVVAFSSPIDLTLKLYVRQITWASRNDPDEYRLQQTWGQISTLPGELALVMGYHRFTTAGLPDDVVFAAWDAGRHLAPTGRSDSIYMRLSALTSAIEFGMFIDGSNPGDVVVAFRSDHFGKYLARYNQLHQLTPNEIETENRQFRLNSTLMAQYTDSANHIDEFDPNSLVDARRRTYTAIVQRQGQGQFRRTLLDAYENRCAVTDCDVEQALEAAHIRPYLGPATNRVANGLLLRADVHTLFDLGLVAVDSSTMSLLTSPALASTSYAPLTGRRLRLPTDISARPSTEALDWHRLNSRV